MNKNFISLVAISLLFSSGAVEIDGIAATVGTDTILKSDVVDELKRSSLDASHYSEIRNNLIERRLIIKAAAESKMTMQDWVVENRIREIVDASFGGDRNKLVAALSQQKMPYTEWVKRVKDDMVVSAMRWNTIDKNVSASPAAMREEYKSNPAKYNKSSTVSVSVMMIKPGEEKPEKFDESIAKKYVKMNPKEAFQEEVTEEIFKLKKGDISPWIEIDGWNFKIRKDDESVAVLRSFADAYDDIEMNVRREMSAKLYREWMNRLKAETYIKVY